MPLPRLFFVKNQTQENSLFLFPQTRMFWRVGCPHFWRGHSQCWSGGEQRLCPLDPVLGRNPGISSALLSAPLICSTSSPEAVLECQGLNGAKTLVLPGHLVLVVDHSRAVPQTSPQTLGRHGHSAASHPRDLVPLGSCLHRLSLLGICSGWPWSFAPECSKSFLGPIPFSVFSPPTQAQERPFPGHCISVFFSSQVFRPQGLEAGSSHRLISAFYPAAFFRKEHGSPGSA